AAAASGESTEPPLVQGDFGPATRVSARGSVSHPRVAGPAACRAPPERENGGACHGHQSPTPRGTRPLEECRRGSPGRGQLQTFALSPCVSPSPVVHRYPLPRAVGGQLGL